MKILITGSNGMLGMDLVKVLGQDTQFEIIATDKNDLDVTNEKSVISFVKETNPNVLINCAAYTNVNEAEDNDKSLNSLVNEKAPMYLAKATNLINAKFIHISTDYVFGENKPQGYLESDIPKTQLNEYGRAKYFGEIGALNENAQTYICRTSWLYGANGRNFVDTMIKLASEKTELSIVTDEIGSPTWTVDVCNSIAALMKNFNTYSPGVYHIVNSGNCSRFDQAKFIFDLIGSDIKLNETSLASFERKAKVPNISILNNSKLPKIRDWQDGLREYLLLKVDTN